VQKVISWPISDAMRYDVEKRVCESSGHALDHEISTTKEEYMGVCDCDHHFGVLGVCCVCFVCTCGSSQEDGSRVRADGVRLSGCQGVKVNHGKSLSPSFKIRSSWVIDSRCFPERGKIILGQKVLRIRLIASAFAVFLAKT